MSAKAYNKAEMAHIDISMRALMERHYDLCNYKCMEQREEVQICKKNCFKDIQVPFRHANHMGRDSEEANYRKCLGKRPTFPQLTPDDFTACSNNLFQDRIEMMSNHMAEEAGKIFQITRP